MTVEKKQKILDCVIIFLICFVPRLLCTLRVYPLTYVSDETSAMHIAAAVSGYDWSDVVSSAGYYGIGFLWIFGILFKFNLTAVTIYRTILTCLAIVNALTGPIFYAIIGRFFGIEDRLKRILVAGICGNLIYFSVQTLAVRNEEILALLVCGAIYLLCRIVAERKFKDEMLLTAVMLYSLTCHTRSVAIIMTVFAVSIIYSIICHKKLFHIITYFIWIVGYVVVHYLLNLYRGTIWGSGQVRNSSVSSAVNSSVGNIMSLGDIAGVIKSWIRIVGGQIYSATTVSGGIFLLASVVCLLFFIYFIRRHRESSLEMAFVVSLTAMILVYLTIFTQGVTWLSGVYTAIHTMPKHTYVYSYKAFTYLRYFGIYTPALIMVGFCIWEKHKLLLKRAVIVIVPCYLLLLLLWVKFILPYVNSSGWDYFYLLEGLKLGDIPTRGNWAVMCIAGVVFILLYLIFVLKNHTVIAMAVSLVLLISESVYLFQNYTIDYNGEIYDRADAGYELIQSMSDMLGKDIYVCDLSERTDHQIYYLYQFMNYTYHIIPGMPDDTEEDFIIFTNSEVDFTDNPNIEGWQLDDNEYVYTNIDEYKEAIGSFE